MLLADMLDESARAYPDQTALCFRDREFTYREMRRRVDALAGALAGLGVGKGGFAAAVSANSNVTVEVLFACARLGAVCERYNVRLSPRVIAQLLARSEARVAFVSAALRPALAEALVGIGRTLMIVDVDGGAGAECGGVPRYEELLASADPVPSTGDVDDGDPAMLLYTSGTTGLPRGVLLSHGALLRRTAIDIEGMRFSHDDILLCELPLFHVTFVSTLATLALGARLVIADSHKPADIAADIVRTGATRTALVPCLMRGLADYVAREGIELDTLELVTYGGEPVEPELLEHCRRLLPCGFLQGYGMTETTAAITMLLPEHHEHPRLLPTVGKAVPGMEIRIVDGEGRVCRLARAGSGRERTRSCWAIMNDLDQTARVVKDGWYRTGDIGFPWTQTASARWWTVEQPGHNRGENVYPLEVSRCIKALAACRRRGGNGSARQAVGRIAGGVRGPRSEQRASPRLISWRTARTRLGGYKPHAVVFVDDLRVSGKVSREQLGAQGTAVVQRARVQRVRGAMRRQRREERMQAWRISMPWSWGPVAPAPLRPACWPAKGKSVLMIERGLRCPGARNMTGRLYAHALGRVFPGFESEAPLERKIVRERVSLIIERARRWSSPRRAWEGRGGLVLSAARAVRPLARRRLNAGAECIYGIAVEDLVWDGGRIVGVRAGEDEITADVTILADGVNSLLSERRSSRASAGAPHQLLRGAKGGCGSFPSDGDRPLPGGPRGRRGLAVRENCDAWARGRLPVHEPLVRVHRGGGRCPTSARRRPGVPDARGLQNHPAVAPVLAAGARLVLGASHPRAADASCAATAACSRAMPPCSA